MSMRLYAKEENGLVAHEVMLTEEVANDLTTTAPGYALDARQGRALDLAKLGLTQLWSGSWGGFGSSNITVNGIQDYAYIAFYVHGQVFHARFGSLVYVYHSQLTSSGYTNIKSWQLNLTGNVLSIVAAKRIQISPTGAVSVFDISDNPIVLIWGVRK